VGCSAEVGPPPRCARSFLYGLLRGYSTRKCCQIGCLSGAAVVRTMGSELSPADWQWLHARLHGELAAAVVRDSASVVQQVRSRRCRLVAAGARLFETAAVPGDMHMRVPSYAAYLHAAAAARAA
jgi:hypothetical protein